MFGFLGYSLWFMIKLFKLCIKKLKKMLSKKKEKKHYQCEYPREKKSRKVFLAWITYNFGMLFQCQLLDAVHKIKHCFLHAIYDLPFF